MYLLIRGRQTFWQGPLKTQHKSIRRNRPSHICVCVSMAGVIDTIKLWGTASLYGVLVMLGLLKQTITSGPGKVFRWKQWDRPKELDDPNLGTHGFLTLKDVRIHYVASGPEDKPLMLFVHGYPEFWYSWRYQIREFQKDYRVVAIDQRGYSESSKPPGIDSYSMPKLTSDIEQIIHALGYKSCVLVAHDWGGLVVWSFAKLYPKLVDKLIVMNCPPFPTFKKILNTSKIQARKSWYVFFFQLPWLPELTLKLGDYSLFERMLPKKPKSDSSEDADKAKEKNITPYKYTFSQPGAITPPMNYYRHVMRNQSQKEFTDFNLEYEMPVLLIWGCQDMALDISFPDTIEREAPKIEVKRIPDASHFVQVDDPDEVNKIMREWLGKH